MADTGPKIAIAAIGDTADVRCWSGIPYHFWIAAQRAGWNAVPLRLNMDCFLWPRRWWNIAQCLKGYGPGGYQYSRNFLDSAEPNVTQDDRDIISFHQQFPRAASMGPHANGSMRYIDATFAGLHETGALGLLSRQMRDRAMELERQNYSYARWIVTMARWTAESAVQDCGAPAECVKTILPGANVELPFEYDFPVKSGRPGKDRPLVLGFIGKDWRRKGLPFLIGVRAILRRMGLKAIVRVVGHCPKEYRRKPGIEYVGFLDKKDDAPQFIEFLVNCDLGCLFSSHEPLGISTLEFLRGGVPVAGFTVEGLMDTLPIDAALRFAPNTSAENVASAIYDLAMDGTRYIAMRESARRWSPLVTWDRCIREWTELLGTGMISKPVQPWIGLPR